MVSPVFLEELHFVSLLKGCVGERLFSIGTITQTEFFDHLIPETTFVEVAEPDGPAIFIFPKLGCKVFLRKFRNNDLAFMVVALLDIFGPLLFFLYFDVVFFCQPSQ